ncbi:hypothetical protein FLW53_23300 [Microbispora sp. SCL1-1]|uniref:hypothetical protein n=1 Tax=unclassified Microbispora TaxID=2614687 RepID=UPI0011577641|nr:MULTISPECIES: hypothetical protein [unclassified Microbispora]NJP27070.1 hypothetical protein [Microbispora sp. CL1-1]TQS11418.1 hypothetical protein FLW53_23300 [Microbispora sp. SCL1-1]
MNLPHLANLWPLNLKVQHTSTRRTGTIALCAPRDPIAVDLLNGAPAAHAVLRSGNPIVFVDFGDGHPAWYRTTVLRKATDSPRTVWQGRPRGWR